MRSLLKKIHSSIDMKKGFFVDNDIEHVVNKLKILDGGVKMKRTIVAMFAIVAFAGSAFAVSDVIEMKKNVKFTHKKHNEALKDCTKCHAKPEGGKIEGFGKDLAHGKGCKGCHVEMKKGPTSCKECHK